MCFYLTEKLDGLLCELDVHLVFKDLGKTVWLAHDVCVRIGWLVV